MYANKISTFKLKKPIEFTLGNEKVVQQLMKEAFVNIIIRDHIEQMVCYLKKLNMYSVILDDR